MNEHHWGYKRGERKMIMLSGPKSALHRSAQYNFMVAEDKSFKLYGRLNQIGHDVLV